MTHIKTVCFAVLFAFLVPAQAALTSDASPRQVLGALVSGQAVDLEQYFSGVAEKRRESGSDYAQFNAYQIFATPNPELQQHLDNWVNQFPGSPHALSARGLHHFAVALEHRGTRKTSNTSAARIKRMKEYMDQAQSDFSSAIQNAPGFTIPVAGLINVYKIVGNRVTLKRLAREGLSMNPGSYAIRYAYLQSQVLKWGGTFEKLMAFLDETTKKSNSNPDLNYLRGFGYAAIAEGYSENKEHDKAVRFAEQAAALGLNDRELLRVAMVLFHGGKYEDADHHLDRALDLYPARAASLYWKGRVAERLGDRDGANQWYKQALEINPVDTSALRAQAKIFLRRGEYDAAEANYARAIANYASRDAVVIDEYLLMLVSASKDYHEAARLGEKTWPLFKDSSRLFWYSWGIALAGEKNCKTVAVMKRYQQNCAGIANICDASALESAEKQIRAVVDPGTCEDMPAFAL